MHTQGQTDGYIQGPHKLTDTYRVCTGQGQFMHTQELTDTYRACTGQGQFMHTQGQTDGYIQGLHRAGTVYAHRDKLTDT